MKGSWAESIKNRFKHVRKYEKKRQRSCMQSTTLDEQPASTPLPVIKRPRRIDFWNEIPAEGNTTDAIQKDHQSELLKEVNKSASSQDKNKVKTLMACTYNTRRRDILTIMTPVRVLIDKYPPLATFSGVRNSSFKYNFLIYLICQVNL
jgi:hypothetical protein